MIRHLKAFGAFWFDFVIGDDWRVAVGVVTALAVTFVAARFTGISTWWIVPTAVVILLPVSIWRETRARQPHRQD